MESTPRWTIGTVVVTLVIFGAILAASSKNPPPTPTTTVTDDQATILAVTDSDWVRGPAGAPVTLIEYSDFQCPACGSYEPQLQQLTQEFPDTLRIVYRHWPLPKHANADLMARAAEAAGLQGKFWEMHDLIFAHQQAWSTAESAKSFASGLADQLGLDVKQFDGELYASSSTDRIALHKGQAAKLGLTGTPSFFLNGQPFQNPRSYDAFKAAIVAAQP